MSKFLSLTILLLCTISNGLVLTAQTSNNKQSDTEESQPLSSQRNGAEMTDLDRLNDCIKNYQYFSANPGPSCIDQYKASQLAKLESQRPKAVVTQPKPVVTQPKTVVTQPKVVVTQPKPVATQPKVVVTQPKATVIQPKSIVTLPKAIIAQPQTLVTQPKAVVTQPKAAVTLSTPTLTSLQQAAQVAFTAEAIMRAATDLELCTKQDPNNQDCFAKFDTIISFLKLDETTNSKDAQDQLATKAPPVETYQTIVVPDSTPANEPTWKDIYRSTPVTQSPSPNEPTQRRGSYRTATGAENTPQNEPEWRGPYDSDQNTNNKNLYQNPWSRFQQNKKQQKTYLSFSLDSWSEFNSADEFAVSRSLEKYGIDVSPGSSLTYGWITNSSQRFELSLISSSSLDYNYDNNYEFEASKRGLSFKHFIDLTRSQNQVSLFFSYGLQAVKTTLIANGYCCSHEDPYPSPNYQVEPLVGIRAELDQAAGSRFFGELNGYLSSHDDKFETYLRLGMSFDI